MAEGEKREPSFDIRLVDGPVPYEPPPYDRDGGGENSFLGRTRAELHPSCGELRCLRYEAKESMAKKLLLEIAQEAAAKHGLLFVRMVHALGEVPVGEASILCQVVSAHRKETFEATAELMNKLKAKVPIWKQEVWDNGETWQDGAPIDPKA
uniref:Molybdenum cofactor biosynthesis protein MoaE n=1 Tax=Hemiselmis andersenii TaxID=464988 RepID=A0A6T8PDY5_HEMAN|mmetsp:Transcript_7162/g.16414  ORF Transcript_7162/g.16414 Transcript_7162/m.16414 type:complete len:152 (+) Transcript_7162:463-918(+)